MMLSSLAEAVGKGLFAGLAGTAAITASTMIEMKLRGREASEAPAEAVSEVFDVEPADEDAKAFVGNVAHWAYGTTWGAARGLLGTVGLKGPAATATHFAAVWGAALAMLPSLGIAPPPTKWSLGELAIDAWHHAAYAAAAGLVYAWLDRE